PHPLPTQADVDNVLGTSNFPDFGGGSPDFPFMGCLEQVHGWPHTWIGATMANIGFAACDPIFWSHHANVDRIWSAWQKTHASANPSDLTAVLSGLDNRWTINDTLDTTGSRLGYEYVVDSQQLLFEENTITDIPVTKTIRLPRAFRRAEVRIEGLMSMTPLSMQLSIRVGSTKITLSLFGLHPHHMTGAKTVPPPDVNSCFEQQEHQNACGDLNVRGCFSQSAFSRHEISVNMELGITGIDNRTHAAIMFKDAYVVFK